MKKYSKLIWILRCVLAVIPFLMMDRALRVATNCGGWYSMDKLPPSLFSLGFGALFVCLALLPRRRGRLAYGLIYGVWMIYAVVQYSVWRIFDRFLFRSDVRLAGEGLDVAGDVGHRVEQRSIGYCWPFCCGG